MFSELKVNDFRALKNETFQLGKYITMLAGWNATGKSTLLALLANSSELKKEDGKTYNDKLFRADFSEILKGSIDHDETKSNRAELVWSDNGENITKTFRTTWQNNKSRFRVIPQGKDENSETTTAKKFPFPVLYLGLSRLYPLGETKDKQIQTKKQLFKNEQDNTWFVDAYKKILSSYDNIKEITNIDISLAKKNTSCISADNYDWKANSSGQDNLSQILFAVLSFKNLKREKECHFKGGLLIIDEIEASLHPRAQEKVIEFLIKEAKNTGFQVIFTTHSLTIIKKFAQTTRTNNNDGNVISYYFTKANGQIEIRKNEKYEDIENDLMAKLYEEDKPEKIIVYTEDDEARWFLKKLIPPKWFKRINLRKINIGCNALIDLMNVESAFTNRLVIFDGDLNASAIRRIKKNKNNYFLLPVKKTAKQSPEEVLHEFLFSEDANTYYQKQYIYNQCVKTEYFYENDVEQDGSKIKRELYKEWFKKHKLLFEKSKILDYWKKANCDIVDSFKNKFKTKFNLIADKCNIPRID